MKMIYTLVSLVTIALFTHNTFVSSSLQENDSNAIETDAQWYYIQSSDPDLVIEIPFSHGGDNLELNYWNGADNQQWKFVSNTLSSKVGGLFMDIGPNHELLAGNGAHRAYTWLFSHDHLYSRDSHEVVQVVGVEKNGAILQLGQEEKRGLNQYFRFIPVKENLWYYLESADPDLVIELPLGHAGANLELNYRSGADNQLWRFLPGNVLFSKTSYVMESGPNHRVVSDRGNHNRPDSWVFRHDHLYNAVSHEVLDLSCGFVEAGSFLLTDLENNEISQHFKMVSARQDVWYYIESADPDLVVDIPLSSADVNLELNYRNGADNQLWQFVSGNYLFSKTGQIMEINSNNEVVVGNGDKNEPCTWVLRHDHLISKASNEVVDLQGGLTDGALLKMGLVNYGINQHFKLVPISKAVWYYIQSTDPHLVIEVPYPDVNLELKYRTGADNQQWQFVSGNMLFSKTGYVMEIGSNNKVLVGDGDKNKPCTWVLSHGHLYSRVVKEVVGVLGDVKEGALLQMGMENSASTQHFRMVPA